MKIVKCQENPKLAYTIQYPEWLSEQVRKVTNNYKTSIHLDKEDFSLITDWAYSENPDLSKLDLDNALHFALLWKEKQTAWKEKQTAKNYKTNDVVYQCAANSPTDKGWKIVKLPEEDLEIERDLMADNNRGDYAQSYDKSYTFFVNSENPPKEYNGVMYSLRDPNNVPQATIEIVVNKDNPSQLTVREVFGKEFVKREDYSKAHKYADKIKEFFNYLKSQGYVFTASEGLEADFGSSSMTIGDLEEANLEDQFGLLYSPNGIGGNADTYFENLQEAYNKGFGGSDWYQRTSIKHGDSLVNYAAERNELDELENAIQKFEEWAGEAWFQNEDQYTFENPYPNEEDFTTYPDIVPSQPEFKDMPEGKPLVNQEAYDKALMLHDEEVGRLQEEFEPYVFGNYMYRKVQETKQIKAKEDKKLQKTRKKLPRLANMKTKIIKIADTKEIPSGEQLALIIKSLKMYLKDNPNIDKEYVDLISKLPSPRQIRQDFSIQECKILYETVEYLWKKIAGQTLISDKISPPETLSGNYWMLSNGILLEGVNSYDILKRNSALICSLLDIGGLTMQEYLHSSPNQLIKFIIRHGGVRLFINQNRNLYAQCDPSTFGSWARAKIKNLNFKKKVIKVIDQKAAYKGWSSGITLLL